MFDPSELSADAIGQYTWKAMRVRTDPSSHDYLEFAKLDLADGSTSRHLVNSLSNVKRALHLRMEDLCLGFGAVELRKLSNFPALAEYIRKCGVVAPRVLDRLNTLRNSVEHDYTIPTESEVETFIDVTELFISATDRWKDRQPCEVEFDRTTKDKSGQYGLSALRFDWDLGIASLHFQPVGSMSPRETKKKAFSVNEDEFFACVRFTLANNY